MSAEQFIIFATNHYEKSAVDMLRSALAYATIKHQGQARLSGEAYIEHPIAVATILVEWQLDLESVMAGLLHDVLESSDTDLKEIESRFGREVAFLVDGVTKVSEARSGMRNISTYLPQTRDNLSKFLMAICSDLRVMLIKLADRLHNMRTVQFLPPDRQLKIAQETLDVFAPLADRLGFGRLRVELEEIAFSCLMPDEYQRLSSLMKKRLGSTQKPLEKIRRDVIQLLAKHGITNHMDGRIKSIYSLYKKFQKVDTIDEIYDLLALRIIVQDKETCYQVLGLIHGIYQPMIKKIKDYISVPKPNGYQSLHTTVLTPYEQIVEFQIRTEAMHIYAERGLAASFHYNDLKQTKLYAKGKISQLPQSLNWIIDLQERVQSYVADSENQHIDLSLDLFPNRIFVFSPKGDIYNLPEGSTALDFAYSVHSDVGDHAQGAQVNSKMGKLVTVLENGDIIKIITAKNAHPTEGWLDQVCTEKARHKIRSYLLKHRLKVE